MRRGVVVAGLMACVLLAAVPAPGAAAGEPVDRAVHDLVARGFPGAVAQVRTGERVRQVSAGVANVATGEPAAPWHEFRIASNTKAFVATVLLQLAGEGALSLDDPVARWLPGVVAGNGNDGAKITVRQLLNHRSGLYDPASTPEFFAPYLEHGDRGFVYRPRDVVAMAMAHPPLFPPGTDASYSNTNYLLAGMIIERVTGLDAILVVHQRILWPLGLWRTSFPRTDPYLHGPHLHGYDLAGNDMTVFSPSYDWTAGAMVSTVDDLARFQRTLFAGELLRPEQQRELRELAPGSGYGLGVQAVPLRCPGGVELVWGTQGSGPGYFSFALTSADGARQLVLALTSYDLGRDVRGEFPAWPSDPTPALTAALCAPTTTP